MSKRRIRHKWDQDSKTPRPRKQCPRTRSISFSWFLGYQSWGYKASFFFLKFWSRLDFMMSIYRLVLSRGFRPRLQFCYEALESLEKASFSNKINVCWSTDFLKSITKIKNAYLWIICEFHRHVYFQMKKKQTPNKS